MIFFKNSENYGIGEVTDCQQVSPVRVKPQLCSRSQLLAEQPHSLLKSLSSLWPKVELVKHASSFLDNSAS